MASSSSSPHTQQTIFLKEFSKDDQCWYLTPNPNVTRPERRDLTKITAKVLQQPRLLANAELTSCLFEEPQLNTVYYWKLPEGCRHPAYFEFSEDWLNEHGMGEDFDAAQRILLQKDYQPHLDKISNSSYANYKKQSGTIYQYGVTVEPGGGASRTQLSPTTRNYAKIQGSEMNKRLYSLVSRAIDIGFPEFNSAARRQDNLKHAAFLPVPKSNQIFTNFQINYAKPGADLAVELKKFGDAHPDQHDDPTSLTLMVNMSNLESNAFGGRFIIPAFKVAVPLQPKSICGFSARFLHFATPSIEYAVPSDSALRLPISESRKPYLDSEEYPYRRCTIPIYTDIRIKYPKFDDYKIEIFQPITAEALFEDTRGHQEWMMNFFIVFEERIRSLIHVDYEASPAELFGKGPKFIIAALSTSFADVTEKILDLKKQNIMPKSRKRPYTPAALSRSESIASKAKRQAFTTLADANVNAVEKPQKVSDPADSDGDMESNNEEAESAERVFQTPHFYTNLFGFRSPNNQHHTPSISLATEIISAIQNPNHEFEQLKKDMQDLSCGDKFKMPNKKESLAEWHDYETDWDVTTEEGISRNPDWIEERGELKEMVDDANRRFEEMVQHAETRRDIMEKWRVVCKELLSKQKKISP